MIGLGKLVMILHLHRQGLSVSAIARQLERDRKTVRKYIEHGLAAPACGPREPRPTLVTPFAPYLRERIADFPGLTGSRLPREIRELGYAGGYTVVKDFLRTIRPKALQAFERRFETPPGKQAQATGRIVLEHFAEEQPYLKALPAMPFTVVLALDRRITRDGMVSVGGNLYSVPDSTRRRIVEVRTLADEIRILEDNQLTAVHPVLEGRGQRRIAGGHRTAPPPGNSTTAREMAPPPAVPAGAIVVPRSLAFYDAVARRLAGEGGRP